MRLALVLSAAAGCHVTTRTELTRTVASRAEPDQAQARAQPPTIVLADGGFRFIEPLVCPSVVIAEVEPEIQRKREPNVATFVVGVLAVAGGAIAAVSGLSSDDPGSNPLTYGGATLAGVGLPFAIGPWFGNQVDHEPGTPRTERRSGGEIACGSRGFGGGAAMLTIGERQIYADIGDDGAFKSSPFTWIDAFDPTGGAAFAVRAELAGRTSWRVIEKVFDAGALAPWRDGFLAATRLDVGVEPLRALPRVTTGTPRVAHVLLGRQPALHVVLPVQNTGPGDAWQVRATIVAASPELDGRILYIGRVAANGAGFGEVWIPLSPDADEEFQRGTIELGFRLVDAHATMPAAPIRFRGEIVDDGFQ
jgi:hypothetical protein